jgi:hypothetical protein
MAAIVNPKIDIFLLDRIREFIRENHGEIVDVTNGVVINLATFPHQKSVTELVDKENRIWEAKGSATDNWIRLFWFWHKPSLKNSVIVVTHAYLKKQNRPERNKGREEN